MCCNFYGHLRPKGQVTNKLQKSIKQYIIVIVICQLDNDLDQSGTADKINKVATTYTDKRTTDTKLFTYGIK